MLIDRQIKQYIALNKWFQSPLGLLVTDEITKQLEPVVDYLRGETLLQLGQCADNPWLEFLNFNYKWVTTPYLSENNNHLECSFNQIPLNRNSIDCIIAPLTLEPFTTSLSLIDELDRVLKPMGYIVFLCINPWSLWGSAMKLGLLNCFDKDKTKLYTPFHLNRLLIQRGYRQCSLSNFCYIPPINNQSVLKKLAIFNEVGKMIWPLPSGLYCYIAQKYEPIHPSLIAPSIILENAVEPTTSGYCTDYSRDRDGFLDKQRDSSLRAPSEAIQWP